MCRDGRKSSAARRRHGKKEVGENCMDRGTEIRKEIVACMSRYRGGGGLGGIREREVVIDDDRKWWK